MDYEQIRYEVDGPILTLTLNRPDKLNAFTVRMMHEMIDAFDYTGGSRPPTLAEHRDGGGLVALRIFESKKPVIAAINGPAVGVGITMTLPMDVRIAASAARMGFVFARRASRSGRARTCPSSTRGGRRGRSGSRALLFRLARRLDCADHEVASTRAVLADQREVRTRGGPREALEQLGRATTACIPFSH